MIGKDEPPLDRLGLGDERYQGHFGVSGDDAERW